MSVMYEYAHDAIPFHLLEMSFITTPNQNYFKYLHKVHFSKFFREHTSNLAELRNGKQSVLKLPVNGIVLVTRTRVILYQIS